MKKIKIIDLLNMHARNEEMPEKIRVGNSCEILTYDGYIYTLDGTPLDGFLDFFNCLNDEVEIIEEDKKIEKLGKICDGFNDSYYDTCLLKIAQKVDEVIDAVNKLKVDGKD